MATLPFSTGVLFLNKEQLMFPAVWYVCAGIPCIIGWMSASFLVCYPFLCMLDDDPYVHDPYYGGPYGRRR